MQCEGGLEDTLLSVRDGPFILYSVQTGEDTMTLQRSTKDL